MESLYIRGRNRLEGTVAVHGSKNSALPVLAASVAARGECVFHNCPELSDVRAVLSILGWLGCSNEKNGVNHIIDPACVFSRSSGFGLHYSTA